MEQLFNTVIENEISVVIIDTLRKALSGKSDESDNAAMGAILYRIADFAHSNNVAIVLTHHTTKSSTDDPFNSIRGAGAIRGAYDVGIVLQRDTKEKEAVLHVESRDIEIEGMTITFDKSSGWTYSGDGEQLEKLRSGRKVIAALKELGGWQTTEDIAKHMGIAVSSAREQLKTANEKGHLQRKDGEKPKGGGRIPDVWST